LRAVCFHPDHRDMFAVRHDRRRVLRLRSGAHPFVSAELSGFTDTSCTPGPIRSCMPHLVGSGSVGVGCVAGPAMSGESSFSNSASAAGRIVAVYSTSPDPSGRTVTSTLEVRQPDKPIVHSRTAAALLIARTGSTLAPHAFISPSRATPRSTSSISLRSRAA
jgi:hypothetical protein